MSHEEKLMKAFGSKKFDTEHTISMFAANLLTIRASEMYDTETLKLHSAMIQNCHIYAIGLTPKTRFMGITQNSEVLNVEILLKEKDTVNISVKIPDGAILHMEQGGPYYVQTVSGEKFQINLPQILANSPSISAHMKFEVLYIGQAYGEDGNRNAIDRLMSHDKLLKISLKEDNPASQVTLMLIEVEPSNQLITMFNPFAKEKDDEMLRIDKGIEAARETTEAERISLYEAALIRYFQPKYNKVFANSFPSTNHKILNRCYDKDINAVSAEIAFDGMPYLMFSSKVDPTDYHLAFFDLHEAEDRKVFFSSTD